MSFTTETSRIDCPYCGERVELIVDLSVEAQEYVEDCGVCCRPITLSVVVIDGEPSVTARHEND